MFNQTLGIYSRSTLIPHPSPLRRAFKSYRVCRKARGLGAFLGIKAENRYLDGGK